MAKNENGDFTDPESHTDLQDEEYLQVAASAALEDKSSGAFDEFHFSEEKISGTPFETAVDSFTELKSKRLKVKETKELNKLRDAVIKSVNALEHLSIRQAWLTETREETKVKIDHQASVLRGEATGIEGLKWEAPVPLANNRLSARFTVFSPVIVMVIAGLVDLSIIATTYFQLFPGSEEEAWLFTIPAVAVQVAFPHFMGTRLAQLVRKSGQKVLLVSQFVFLLIGWGLFVFALVLIRVQSFQVSESAQILVETGTYELAVIAFGIASAMMLIGLGVWLIMAAMHDNPHIRFYLRNWLHLQRIESELQKIAVSVESQSSLIEMAENAHAAAKSAFEDAINAYRLELAVAAKDVYRRSFINAFGKPSFTATYLTRTERHENKPKTSSRSE